LLAHPARDERGLDAAAGLVDDPRRFRDGVERQFGRERVLMHIRIAALSGVHAVPALFLMGVPYNGEPDATELAAAVDAGRRRPS
jgi:protein-disulfide isomerase